MLSPVDKQTPDRSGRPVQGRRRSIWRLMSDLLFVTRRDRKWWLLPLVLLVLLLAGLLALAALSGPMAPFIYPLL